MTFIELYGKMNQFYMVSQLDADLLPFVSLCRTYEFNY